MTTVQLNNVDHHDMRVITRHAAEFGDAINQVLVFPTEFEDIQREYPIFFTPDANGDLQAVALLGLDRDENLFLDDTGWQARYVPAAQQRGPFVIGMAESGGDPMIHVDPEHPRIGRGMGEGMPLFLPHGGNAPYLEHISGVLRTIYTGLDLIRPMFDAFGDAGLIEPVAVQVQLSDTEQYDLPDYSTISGERLGALDGAALERLHRAGFLYAAFLVVASTANVNRLIERKLARSAAG
ncbi:SapC family protein [Sphingomonas sp. DG1-23]|uniref:SapC family protein n=1 Tax=Sphingomonas sp. DG1-23 TaxID=3068316 RepID=UPI00273D8279|nr:SapC family protein [Sphingomonas sp. DG1-23]MDP5279684.1 SapC family protein [Sphingomonas sp. DG1-23]